MLFGRKDKRETDEVAIKEDIKEDVPVAQRVYLVPESHIIMYGLRDRVRRALIGKVVEEGTRIPIDLFSSAFDDFMDELTGKVLGEVDTATWFKVWKTVPGGRVRVVDTTAIYIEGKVSYVDVDALFDKCLGLLVIIEEELGDEIGYMRMKEIFKSGKLDRLEKELLYIEERLWKLYNQRRLPSGDLVRVLECFYQLRKLLEDQRIMSSGEREDDTKL